MLQQSGSIRSEAGRKATFVVATRVKWSSETVDQEQAGPRSPQVFAKFVIRRGIGTATRRVVCDPTVEPAFMSMEMALDIWKWGFPWPLRIFMGLAGNDFQQPHENQGMRHFRMSSISVRRGARVSPRPATPCSSTWLSQVWNSSTKGTYCRQAS